MVESTHQCQLIMEIILAKYVLDVKYFSKKIRRNTCGNKYGIILVVYN